MLTAEAPDLRKWAKGLGTCKSQGPGQLAISGDSRESFEQPRAGAAQQRMGRRLRRWGEGAQAAFGFLLVLGPGSEGRGAGLWSPAWVLKAGGVGQDEEPVRGPRSRVSVWLVSGPSASAQASVSGLSALHVHHPPGPELTQLPHQAGMSRCSGSPRGQPSGLPGPKRNQDCPACPSCFRERHRLGLLVALLLPAVPFCLLNSGTCRHSSTSSQSQPVKSLG